MSAIKRATRLSKDSIIKYTGELEEAGFLIVKREEKRGVKQLNRYTIDYSVIKNSLHDIYDLSGLSEVEKEGTKELLSNWYDYHASKSYRDSNSNAAAEDKPNDSYRSENPTSIGYDESLDKNNPHEDQE
jgi:hypothetical protein